MEQTKLPKVQRIAGVAGGIVLIATAFLKWVRISSLSVTLKQMADATSGNSAEYVYIGIMVFLLITGIASVLFSLLGVRMGIQAMGILTFAFTIALLVIFSSVSSAVANFSLTAVPYLAICGSFVILVSGFLRK